MPVPTSSSRKAWRPADIAALSMQQRPKPVWSGFSVCWPAVVDAVKVPVVATGGLPMGAGRGVSAAGRFGRAGRHGIPALP